MRVVLPFIFLLTVSPLFGLFSLVKKFGVKPTTNLLLQNPRVTLPHGLFYLSNKRSYDFSTSLNSKLLSAKEKGCIVNCCDKKKTNFSVIERRTTALESRLKLLEKKVDFMEKMREQKESEQNLVKLMKQISPHD